MWMRLGAPDELSLTNGQVVKDGSKLFADVAAAYDSATPDQRAAADGAGRAEWLAAFKHLYRAANDADPELPAVEEWPRWRTEGEQLLKVLAPPIKAEPPLAASGPSFIVVAAGALAAWYLLFRKGA